MTTVSVGPNAGLIPRYATTVDAHRRAWSAKERSAQRAIDTALAQLEADALAVFRVDDKRPRRWRRLPSNLGHLLDLAAGVAESSIAAAELDLVRARRVLRNIEGGR